MRCTSSPQYWNSDMGSKASTYYGKKKYAGNIHSTGKKCGEI